MKIIRNIILLIILIIIFYQVTRKEKKMVVRTAFSLNSFSKLVNDYDPQRNSGLGGAFFTYSMYLTMIDYGDNGDLKAQALESFYFNGKYLHLKINKELKTSKGRPLDVKDLEYSIRRLLVRSDSLHGDLAKYICGVDKLNSFFDDCIGLKVDNDELILTVKDDIDGGLLIPWLTSIDIPVIPFDAMDVDSKNIDIIDFSNTTGAFYTDKKITNLTKILKQNNYSKLFLYDKYDLELVFYKDMDDLKKISIDKKLDLIPTFGISEKFAKEVAVTDSKSLIYKTLPIHSKVLNFKKMGRDHLTIEERVYIGKKIKQYLKEKLKDEEENYFSDEIYPQGSDLSLDENQINALNEVLSSSKEYSKTFSVSVVNNVFESYILELARKSNLKISPINLKGEVLLKSENDSRVIGAISGFDTGHFESLAGINYEISVGIHGPQKDCEEAILKYLKARTKSERLEIMRELQFRTLKNVYTFPLYSSPFFAVTFNGWKAHFNPYFAISQVWQLQKL